MPARAKLSMWGLAVVSGGAALQFGGCINADTFAQAFVDEVSLTAALVTQGLSTAMLTLLLGGG